jgi:hypothetical protein
MSFLLDVRAQSNDDASLEGRQIEAELPIGSRQ